MPRVFSNRRNSFTPSALALAITAAMSAPSILAAQQPMEPSPSINVSAQEEVRIAADRARINISVQTRATTAAAAATDNATKQNRVLAALRALGIPNERLTTSNYSVNPEYRYPQNESPVLTGYTVTNTIVVESHDVKQVGKIIDAALGAGANMISSLDFYASNTDSARSVAIASAIAKARAEAEVVAKAAGGTLGGMLEANVSGNVSSPPPMPRMYAKAAMEAGADTSINPGQETVTVSVNTRWRFNGAR